MTNLLRMVADLPPFPLNSEELERLNVLLTSQSHYSFDEFSEILFAEVQVNPAFSSKKRGILIYWHASQQIAASFSQWKEVITKKWQLKFPDQSLSLNQVSILLNELLPDNSFILSTLRQKLSEATQLMHSSEEAQLLTELASSVDLKLQDFKFNGQDDLMRRISDFKKDSEAILHNDKIEIANRFVLTLKKKGVNLTKEFFSDLTKDYSHQLDLLAQDLKEEGDFIEDRKQLCVLNDKELYNLMNEYLTLHFTLPARKPNSLTYNNPLAYFNPWSYSLSFWKNLSEINKEEPQLTLVETNEDSKIKLG